MNYPTYLAAPVDADLGNRPILARAAGYVLVHALLPETTHEAFRCFVQVSPCPVEPISDEPLISISRGVLVFTRKRYYQAIRLTRYQRRLLARKGAKRRVGAKSVKKEARVGANVYMVDGTPETVVRHIVASWLRPATSS